IVSPALATELNLFENHVEITTNKKQTYSAQVLLVTSGANRRKLEVPGAAEYDQKGLTYCASCDGLLFADQDVAVVGGGNAGFETALQFLAYCKSVTLVHKGPEFKADAITVNSAIANPKMRAIKNAEPIAVLGEQFVTGLKIKDIVDGKE